MPKAITRVYKVTDISTGKVRMISAINKYQAVAFVADEFYDCAPIKPVEAIELSVSGAVIENAC